MVVSIVAALGWMSACLMVGLYLGERKTRILMHNMQTYGTAAVGKAEVWMPSMEAPAPPGPRLVPEDEKSPQWSDETIEKGVADLLRQARELGVPTTEAEAREEVMMMLNSDTGEML